jgi:hypothetical protein
MTPPGRLVGEASATHLAGLHQVVQGGEGLFHGRLVAVGLLIPEDAEGLDGPVRPVELIEVHVVGLQPPQAVVDGLLDVDPVQPRLAVADVGEARARAVHLGGDDDPVALAARGQPVADDLLGAPVGLGARRHRVHLGRVEEVDPVIEGIVELLEGLGLAVRLAPGHGAQADGAHHDIAAPQSPVVHALPFSRSWSWSSPRP